jgi:preprotein translocase subunit SecD
MGSLINRTVTALSVVIISGILFFPNIAEQRLAIVFKEYTRAPDGTKAVVEQSRIDAFIKGGASGLGRYFTAPCIPEKSDRRPATHICVLESRFITSARINEMVQEHPDLIDEFYTRIQPHPIERFFSFLLEDADFKNLKIKLGLDLQGGMRAIFRADFEAYISGLNEKYAPIIKELEAKIQKPSVSEQEKSDARNRLEQIQSLMSIDETRKEELLMEAKRIIDKRLASQNLTEPEVRIQPASYSIGVDMPGAANTSDVLNKIKDTVTVEYRIVNAEATNRLNAEFDAELNTIRNLYKNERVDEVDVRKILDDVKKRSGLRDDEGRVFLFWRRGRAIDSQYLPREFRVLGPVVLDGSDMTNARENPNATSGWYDINFELSGLGAEKFASVTTREVGKNLAILWGDRVVSDPRIRTPIIGGFGVIEGDFNRDEAAEIANVIREGALPLPLEILSVNFVGPGLGQESIVTGITSVILGFILVVAFMLLYYRLAGVVAVIALFLNLLMMAAVLSLLEFTLTLPGFAGVILTVGMAVDANVIIYEKMREELAIGRPLSVVVESGFASSFWTILDSNVTSLIAAVILFYNGDGPIKGFAITLFFGLVSSMFTALYVSRLLFDWMLQYGNLKRLNPGLNIRRKTA